MPVVVLCFLHLEHIVSETTCNELFKTLNCLSIAIEVMSQVSVEDEVL